MRLGIGDRITIRARGEEPESNRFASVILPPERTL